MMQIKEKIEKESEGIQARLENMEKRLTALVDEKIENATKTTCEKLEKSYADVKKDMSCEMRKFTFCQHNRKKKRGRKIYA